MELSEQQGLTAWFEILKDRSLFFTWKTRPVERWLQNLGCAKDTDATTYQGGTSPGKSLAQQS